MAKKKSKKKAKEYTEAARTVDVKEPAVEETGPKQICFENRIPKRNIFLADHYREEQDNKVFENKIMEIGKQNFKRNVLCVTKIKHMVVSESGEWVTEFIIDMRKDK